MERPNIERIALLFSPDWTIKSMPLISSFEKQWEKIESGETSYEHSDDFLEMLKEYNLELHFPELKFLLYSFLKWSKFTEFVNSDIIKANREKNTELLNSLKLLHDCKGKASLIISTPTNGKYTIQSSGLIEVVTHALLEHFKVSDTEYLIKGILDEQIDWIEYVNAAFEKQKAKTSRPGRKKGDFTKNKIVFYLWKYLQEYTQLKAAEGKEYSNDQAKFIFQFLKLNNFIDTNNEISKKEDVIGYYLKEYRKSKRMQLSVNQR